MAKATPTRITVEVSALIRHKLMELRGPEPQKKGDRQESLRKLGDLLGVSHVRVKTILEGDLAGKKVEDLFCDRYYEGSVDKMRAAAKAFVLPMHSTTRSWKERCCECGPRR